MEKLKKSETYMYNSMQMAEHTGSTRQFTRKNIYINLEKYNLKTVPVYISTKNTSKYYIDIDEAIQIAKSNK